MKFVFIKQVLDDFRYMFADNDHEALIKMWSNIAKKPFQIFRIALDRKVDSYHRDATLHDLLTFVKLFPVHKMKFERSVNALITFSDVSINNSLNSFVRAICDTLMCIFSCRIQALIHKH